VGNVQTAGSRGACLYHEATPVKEQRDPSKCPNSRPRAKSPGLFCTPPPGENRRLFSQRPLAPAGDGVHGVSSFLTKITGLLAPG
ncbi:MAG TPA: hypothetical protein VGH07_06770, partial [Chthoniobacterales bacterium]